MLKHPDYTRERISQLVQRIGEKIYAERVPIDELTVAGPVDRIRHADAQQLTGFRAANVGEKFGPLWATYWFRGRVATPTAWAGARVDLLWDSQSEATLWLAGRSAQGLNMTQGDRPDAVLLERCQGGETIEFQVEMACNVKFGSPVGDETGGFSVARTPFVLRRCEVARFDPQAWDLYWDVYVLAKLEAELAKEGGTSDRSWQGLLLAELNRFCNVFNLDDRQSWNGARQILEQLYENHNATRTLELSVIGHAHIDTAWLWPLAETHRKCERSFSSATTYMQDYPEYRFSCSQAYQYDVIKQRNPELYARIKKYVAAGQFVPVGGTWIEPDCNIPSGEALCRQFLLGQRFFEREFGKRCQEFWNPDVFGYNGQLPQIMRLAGITRFLTQKLSWNRFNKPPHHTFAWRGIDGSEVLTHFPPADSYNSFSPWVSRNEIGWLRTNLREHRDHDRSREAIMLYGFGDGGGGPTKSMLEVLRRSTDLQGLPRTAQRSSNEFFERLERDIVNRPVMVGELYFEYHRGTYTSQAAVKRNNRRAEQLLHDIEFLSAVSKQAYPRDSINQLWQTLLLNQFHDILPGSSICEVYTDSAKQFAELLSQGVAILPSGTTPINMTGVARSEVVEQAGKLVVIEAPPYGPGKTVASTDTVNVSQEGDRLTLENAQLRAVFNTGGRLVSLVANVANGEGELLNVQHSTHSTSSGPAASNAQRSMSDAPHVAPDVRRGRAAGITREAIQGEGNVFELYEDWPTNYDAWDVDPFHLETRRPCAPAERAEIMRRDPLRAELRFEYAIDKASRLTQVVRLDAGARRLEFHCEADWHSSHQMLKVAFPVNAQAMNATYEMQFGYVERPTHYNTSYDLARYEVPMHRWFDLSEHGFGVAILNDCKYGGSTFDHTMRLSLLRAPKSPDPQCDMGQHRFGFAVMPHGGDWRAAGVVAEAWRFNSPIRFGDATALPGSFALVDDPNLVLDTIKRAEDSEALVLRFYECHGARGTAHIQLARPFKHAVRCNILEDDDEPVKLEGQRLTLEYTPHQVVSVKLS